MGTTCQQFKVRTRRVVGSAIWGVKFQVARCFLWTGCYVSNRHPNTHCGKEKKMLAIRNHLIHTYTNATLRSRVFSMIQDFGFRPPSDVNQKTPKLQ